MIGQRFGRLVVVSVAPPRPNQRSRGKYYLCDCDCGGQTVAYGGHLRHGSRVGCGCVRPAHRTHGLTRSPEYRAWTSAKERCSNPRSVHFAAYGARGITMCQSWMESFEAFLRDMGPRPSPVHSIDRIDNDGPYSPDNCRWATNAEQQNNRRANHRLIVGGVRMTITEAARLTGVPKQTILGRLRAGKSEADAVSRVRLSSRKKFYG